MKEAEFNTYSIYQKSERKKVKEMKWWNRVYEVKEMKWWNRVVEGQGRRHETDGGGEGNEMVKPTEEVQEMKWWNRRRRWRKWNGETDGGGEGNNGETLGGGSGNEMVKPTEEVKDQDQLKNDSWGFTESEREWIWRVYSRGKEKSVWSRRSRMLRIDFQLTLIDSSIGLTS